MLAWNTATSAHWKRSSVWLWCNGSDEQINGLTEWCAKGSVAEECLPLSCGDS